MSVKTKISDLLQQLNKGIYEKEDAIAKSLLSAVAGESIFLLGAPGVAKSLVARQVKLAFKEATAFDYLMNRFSTPDEIFGPISISKLKDQDKYERITTNYLPNANVVFLDEIWKAGPSIQNALLTVLNEKIYRNGDEEIQVPIKALLSASNELPAKNEGLEALWDRFIVRLNVEPIADKQNFNKMISSSSKIKKDSVTNSITNEEYELWKTKIDSIGIPDNIYEVIHVIRMYLAQHNQKESNATSQIYVSDRRWQKIIRLLRTSAFLNDRTNVDLMDCFIIKDCIWNELDEKTLVSEFVNDAIEKHGYSMTLNFSDLRAELQNFTSEIKAETQSEKDTRVKELELFESNYYEILDFDEDDNLIHESDFNSLKNNSKDVSFYYLRKYLYHQNVEKNHYQHEIRKGKTPFTILIDDEEYSLKTITKGEEKTVTKKKPHKAIEKEWDNKTTNLLSIINEAKSSVLNYKKEELQHIRTNIFVDQKWAALVEKHIIDTEKEIEKLEIEIVKIQNDYKNIKDETKA